MVIGSIAYAYNPKGRVTSDTRTINGVAYTTGYRYDSSGRLDHLTYPSGRTVDYSFDTLGRISAVTTTPAGGSASDLATGVTYHPFGGVKSYTLGNGQTYARTYDQDGRITSYTLGSSMYSVGYDLASRIDAIAELGNAANANSYGYDALDRLTSANTPGTNYGYGYDAVGNRISKAVGAGSETYAYSATSNRIATITPSSGPVRSFTLDANGSTTADGINTYAYDFRGRMMSATSSVGTTTYQVNALGQRVRKSNSLTDRTFVHDAKGRLLAEATGAGAALKDYVWLGDTPLAIIDATGSYVIHVDHLNTPKMIANQAGTTVWRWDNTEPFGNSLPNDDPDGDGQPFVFDPRFPGQFFDRETSLAYNYYRDYDPSMGRYVQSDPIGLRGGINLFTYARGAPLSLIDPLGLFTVDAECCKQEPTLNEQLANACKLVASRVTDPKLRDCIMRRCEKARVTCDGLICRMTGVVGWTNLVMGSTITLCIKGNDVVGLGGGWGCVAIHEWAHTCGWGFFGHRGGGGVPGGSGSYDQTECNGWGGGLPPAPRPPIPNPRERQ